MLPKSMALDRIEEMIKKKILTKDGLQKYKIDKQKASPIKFRTKQFKKTSSKQKNLNNNIVIMNMPPVSNIQFFYDQSRKVSPISKKTLFNQNSNFIRLFNNPLINDQLKSSNQNGAKQIKDKKSDDSHQNFFELKRYNSLNIKFSSYDLNKQNTLDSPNFQKSIKKLTTLPTKTKLFIPSIQFKPSFKELIKRKNKINSMVENKFKNSQFNYQRAIKSSTYSRKKAFQKVLTTFQQSMSQKNVKNFYSLNLKSQQLPLKPSKEMKYPRQISTSSRTRIGSPQNIKRRSKKQEETCRPWSSEKKAIIKLQSNEEQNPLQFYPIDGNY